MISQYAIPRSHIRAGSLAVLRDIRLDRVEVFVIALRAYYDYDLHRPSRCRFLAARIVSHCSGAMRSLLPFTRPARAASTFAASPRYEKAPDAPLAGVRPDPGGTGVQTLDPLAAIALVCLPLRYLIMKGTVVGLTWATAESLPAVGFVRKGCCDRVGGCDISKTSEQNWIGADAI
jgi:hypothetical protein